ncbi:hypothetical protein MUK42_15032 [Musa troglodytarum]|uniref:Uncharacterized protein n=1 Tax=Musa troglodytarum TaxID=320322 RepID=A0A9E7H7C6_9LILI|nr:hypothetical protein MUK42_15032 [Musa troglodytarum]URE24528.1 hypothetical protein MUK42_15032 [Musa troglodytarum]
MGSAKGSPVPPSSGLLLASDGSFSALLGLPSDQAVNLLHRLPDPNAVASSGEMWRLCLPPRPKVELLDSAGLRLIAQRSAKKEEGENSRRESPAKKSKRRSEEGTACDESRTPSYDCPTKRRKLWEQNLVIVNETSSGELKDQL